MTHQSARTASHAIHDVSQHASHHELTGLIADVAAMVRRNSSLSDRVRKAAVEQLIEVMDDVDLDLVNQQAEQAWRENETAGFGLSPADRFVAASIAAIRNEPLEMTHD